MFTLDSDSAATIAGIFSTLLIALVVRQPLKLSTNASSSVRRSMQFVDAVFIATLLGLLISVMGCIVVVLNEAFRHEWVDIVVLATTCMLGFTVAAWFTEYVVKWRSPTDG